MQYLPNARSKPLSRLTIYQNYTLEKKRKAEAAQLMPLLLKLDQSLEIDDVKFGNDPPDFILNVGASSIAIELTTVNPTVFGKGGNLRRKDFKEWQAQLKESNKIVNTFEFGSFTLRESLAALKNQFQIKCNKAKAWTSKYSHNWLLFQLTEGSPFGELTGELEATPGSEMELFDHISKVLYEVCAILAEPNPFDYVLIFAGCQLIAFPSDGKNAHKLPMPRWDLVTRGAKVNDSHLDWTSTIKHVNRVVCKSR